MTRQVEVLMRTWAARPTQESATNATPAALAWPKNRLLCTVDMLKLFPPNTAWRFSLRSEQHPTPV